VRVALANFRWPLDPALATGRDETTLARALYATPLRTDPRSGLVSPGLCTAWRASDEFRHWMFTCKAAPSIAAALRRVKLLDGPARWLFADARVSAPSASTLSIRLPYPWRRFPYALTSVGAAPRFVPGPFELVSGSKRLVVVRRAGLTVRFVRLAPLAAVRQFRAGRLDEAPVPLGDIVATRADPQLAKTVEVRTLLGLDVVFIGPVGTGYRVQRAYRDTADRSDYEQLIPELAGSSAYGFLGGEKADPARFRRALDAIPSLPRRWDQALRPARAGAARRRSTPLRSVARRRPRADAVDRASASGARELSPNHRRLSAGGSNCCGVGVARRVEAAQPASTRTGRNTATSRPGGCR